MSARVAGSAVMGIAAGAAVGLACACAVVPLAPPVQAVATSATLIAARIASRLVLEELTGKSSFCHREMAGSRRARALCRRPPRPVGAGKRAHPTVAGG